MGKIDALVELGFSREDILARVLGVGAVGAPLCAVGDLVMVETPTKYWSGKVASVDGTAIRLIDAAWVSDTGRFTQAIQTGDFAEVEPCGSVTVAVGAVMAILPLPKIGTVQK